MNLIKKLDFVMCSSGSSKWEETLTWSRSSGEEKRVWRISDREQSFCLGFLQIRIDIFSKMEVGPFSLLNMGIYLFKSGNRYFSSLEIENWFWDFNLSCSCWISLWRPAAAAEAFDKILHEDKSIFTQRRQIKMWKVMSMRIKKDMCIRVSQKN